MLPEMGPPETTDLGVPGRGRLLARRSIATSLAAHPRRAAGPTATLDDALAALAIVAARVRQAGRPR